MAQRTLAIDDPADLIFGDAPNPVTTGNGIAIGAGEVIPELNFTLPTMEVTDATRGDVIGHYREIITGALERCRELHQDRVIFEFETLLEMTLDPTLGVEIVTVMRDMEFLWRKIVDITANRADRRR